LIGDGRALKSRQNFHHYISVVGKKIKVVSVREPPQFQGLPHHYMIIIDSPRTVLFLNNGDTMADTGLPDNIKFYPVAQTG
jgi:hypothetical protein